MLRRCSRILRLLESSLLKRCFNSSQWVGEAHRTPANKGVIGKTGSSTRWLRRQFADPYVKKAAHDNYRCRSSYKLIELDDKYHFLQPGKVVIDCGASPGSWTQVAVERVLPKKTSADSEQHSLVIAVDLLDIKDIPGAVILGGHDFTSKVTQKKILSLLPPPGANVILSDMAPNSSGNHSIDHEAILELCESAFHFGRKTLAHGGVYLCKLWDGRRTQEFIQRLSKSFKTVKKCKPQASRKESSEIYIYASDFIRGT